MVPEKIRPKRVAMIVEGYTAIRHVDVVAGEAIPRNDPLCIIARQRWSREEYAGKDVASAIAKENPIRKFPKSLRISLDAGHQLIHCFFCLP